MASTSISAQGTTVAIGTATAGAKTITAITTANPAVYTSTAHGLSRGDVVTLAGIVGMTQLNGLTGVVTDLTANNFTLSGAGVRDTTGYTTYTSGGTATPVALTAINNVRTLTFGDAAASSIDVTNLQSTAKEFKLGLMDPGSVALEVDYDYADAGQVALLAAQITGAIKAFKFTLPDSHTVTFNAMVKKVAGNVGVDAVIRRPVELQVTGPYTWA